MIEQSSRFKVAYTLLFCWMVFCSRISWCVVECPGRNPNCSAGIICRSLTEFLSVDGGTRVRPREGKAFSVLSSYQKQIYIKDGFLPERSYHKKLYIKLSASVRGSWEPMLRKWHNSFNNFSDGGRGTRMRPKAKT